MKITHLLASCLLATSLIGCGGADTKPEDNSTTKPPASNDDTGNGSSDGNSGGQGNGSNSGGSNGDSNDGGNNGGNGNDKPVTVVIERISLTGLAIKGLAINARIEAYKANSQNDGFQDTPFATTRTNSEGRYQLQQTSEYRGPVKVVLKQNTETEDAKKARLQCDAPTGCDGTDFGKFYPMPDDFELSVVIPTGQVETANDVKVANLSALTTFATSFIEASDTKIDSDKVEKGNTQIRAVFGLPGDVDLATTEAANITDKDSEGNKLYGVINAAFQEIAEQNKQEDITDVISAFANELKDGQLLIRSQDSKAETTLLNVTTTAEEVAKDDGVKLTEQATTLKTEAEKITSNDNNIGKQTNVIPPVVSAGNTQEVEVGAVVTLTASTKFGTINSYVWRQVPKPVITINNATSTNGTATFTAPQAPGEYTFMVTGNNTSTELSDSDVVRIVVKAKKAEPTLAQQLAGDYTIANGQLGLEISNNHRFNARIISGRKLTISSPAENTLSAAGDAALTAETQFDLNLDDYSITPKSENKSENAVNFNATVSNDKTITLAASTSDNTEVDEDNASKAERIVKNENEINLINIGDGLFIDFHFSKQQSFAGTDNGSGGYNFQADPSEKQAEIQVLTLTKQQDIPASSIAGDFHGLRWGVVTFNEFQAPQPFGKRDIAAFYLQRVNSSNTLNGNKYNTTGTIKQFEIVGSSLGYLSQEKDYPDNRSFNVPVSGISESDPGDTKSSYTMGFSTDGSAVTLVNSFSGNRWIDIPTADNQFHSIEYGSYFKKPSGNVDLTGNQYKTTGIEYVVDKDGSLFGIRRNSSVISITADGISGSDTMIENDYIKGAASVKDKLRQPAAPKQESWQVTWTQLGRASEKGVFTNGQMVLDVGNDTKLTYLTNQDGSKIMIGRYFQTSTEAEISWSIGSKIN